MRQLQIITGHCKHSPALPPPQPPPDLLDTWEEEHSAQCIALVRDCVLTYPLSIMTIYKTKFYQQTSSLPDNLTCTSYLAYSFVNKIHATTKTSVLVPF